VGATFSGGMMEIARKGIFNPEYFYFNEIMIIFLAVMIADVILLDLFNTFGMPTSTTVSIVLELLGAAVAISLIKIYNTGGELNEYINSAKALLIITGILLSIVIAFTFGTVAQYFTRIIFSFDYQKNLKYFGALWGATCITGITYFILIKGAKGSSFITPESLAWITSNSLLIILLSFLIWGIVFELIILFTRINILKPIVLVGTFALAMAFAGNDLVNFIGVPLAGFKSYQTYLSQPGVDPSQLLMTALTGQVRSETVLLIIAGLVMAVTLWLSRKARTVTETEINLSRQGEGFERFDSSVFSRNLVRGSISVSNTLRLFIPKFITKYSASRFDQTKKNDDDSSKEQSSFDLLRASVNLTVASLLISFATSLKLPLSTTYVTFMVAMGSSFGDGAWGRDSAVYRVAGVTAVIGGWFLTAFSAFTAAFAFAGIIYFGGSIAIGILILVAAVFVIKTHALHRRKQTEKQNKQVHQVSNFLMKSDVFQRSTDSIHKTLKTVSSTYIKTIKGLVNENRKELKESKNDIEELNQHVKQLKNSLHHTINNLREDFIETGHYYVQVLDYLRETAHCLTYIVTPTFEHVDNNHKSMLPDQIDDFEKVTTSVEQLFKTILPLLKNPGYREIKHVIRLQREILKHIAELNKKQLKRIKNGEAGTKNSLLYLTILSETKNMLLHTINLLKAQRDFVVLNKTF
jgi:phosphate/sulfate permease